VSCAKTQEFLASHAVAGGEKVDAKKNVLGFDDALALLKEVNEVFVAKGKKSVHLDLKKERPDEATLRGLLLGPTGNLRAPIVRSGKTLLVGFDAASYEKVFGPA
jgi:arsenate reductase-like glutaredoxin family protein